MSTETLAPPLHTLRPRLGPHHAAYLLMLASAAAFATMSACSHALADRCDWRIVPVARSGIAFALTAWMARFSGVRMLFRWPGTLWLRSLVGSFSMLFTFYALSRLPVATAVTLFNTFPLWVTLLAWPVLGERPSAAFGLALASGLLGVALIKRGADPAGSEGLLALAGSVRGAIAAALLSSVCTAVAMLGLHRLRTIHSLAIVVHFSAVATVGCLGFAASSAWTDRPIDLTALADPVTLLLLFAVGGLATLGQIAMTRAFSHGAPQRLAVVGLSQVVFAMGFDFALWGYRPYAVQLLGTLLVLAPVAWLLGRRRP